MKAVQSQPHFPRVEEKLKTELALLHIQMRDTIHGELELKELETVKKVEENPKYFYTLQSSSSNVKRSTDIKLVKDKNNKPVQDKKV